MITKDKIKQQLICYWSAEDESFIAESAVLPHVVMGVGETSEQALRDFTSALDDVFDEITSDNVAGYKMGRPAKGYVALNVNLRPSSKDKISEIANEFKIPQGEAVDYLVFFHECKSQEVTKIPEKSELVLMLSDIKNYIGQEFHQVISKIKPPTAREIDQNGLLPAFSRNQFTQIDDTSSAMQFLPISYGVMRSQPNIFMESYQVSSGPEINSKPILVERMAV